MANRGFEVIVGNVGTVYDGPDGAIATAQFNNYVAMSAADYGRAAGEPVTLLERGEIVREYAGTIGDDD